MTCNETIGKWCKNKHGASKIIDTFETYQALDAHLRQLRAGAAQEFDKRTRIAAMVAVVESRN
jgi:hypothetical protein